MQLNLEMVNKNIIQNLIVLISIISLINTEKVDAKKFLSNLGIKNPLLNPISFLSEGQDDTKLINIKCLYAKNFNMYSLQALQKKDGDYEIKDTTDEKTVLFNFCQNTFKQTDSTVVKIDGDQIIRLAGSIEGEGNDKNVWTQIGDTKNPTGITIDLVHGDKCDENNQHQTQIEVICDSSVETMDQMTFKTMKNCIHHLELRSVYGCTLRSSYLLLRLLNNNKIVFCIIFVIIGLALCLFGNNYLQYAIILVCSIIGCYGLTVAVLNFFPNLITTETWLFVCLGASLLIGFLIGFLLRDEKKLFVIILGGFLGYSLATFLYQIIQNYININPQILYYICLGVCIVVGAIIGYCLAEILVIIGTSVFGGYLAMRGASLVIGNYLDEGYIIDLIKNREWEQLLKIRDGWTYAYLGAWALLTIIGIIVQCKNKEKTKSSDVKK